MAIKGIHAERRGERGVTFLLVVVGMFAILAMAAIAVDIVTIYAAKSDAQKAADAAALAGAKMFVASGITSGSGVANICTGGATDASNRLAAAVAQANRVGGVSASVTNVACNLTNAQDPQITVTVSRNNLPTFFGRIFGQRSATVSATAKAEAYNNSGGSANLQVGSVKPWFIPNCDPTVALPAGGPCTPYFIQSASGYTLPNPNPYIGRSLPLSQATSTGGTGVYYPINTGNLTHADVCPSSSAFGCPAGVGSGTPGTPSGYVDDIACANPNPVPDTPDRPMQCGDRFPVTLAVPSTNTTSGTQCLLHTDDLGPGADQDTIIPGGGGTPVTINGGGQNPDLSLRNVNNISRSDSIVTVPVFDWNGNPCPVGNCSASNLQVIGFLQLGINSVNVGGILGTVVVNAVGCDPNPGTTVVSGGGVAAIPVRLIQ
jgi:hypothetical protein